MLENFSGQLTLSDILHYELPFLNDLQDERILMKNNSHPGTPSIPVKPIT